MCRRAVTSAAPPYLGGQLHKTPATTFLLSPSDRVSLHSSAGSEAGSACPSNKRDLKVSDFIHEEQVPKR